MSASSTDRASTLSSRDPWIRAFGFSTLLLLLVATACADRNGTGDAATEGAPVVDAGDTNGAGVEEDGESAGDAEASIPTDSEASTALAERLERITGSMWWHRDALRDAVGLEDAQGEEMDRRCRAHLRRRWALRKIERSQGPKAFGEALASGDLGAAEQAAAVRRERVAWLETADEQLKLEVLSVLRPEQLAALWEKAPALAHRPWLKAVGGQAGKDRSARPRTVGARPARAAENPAGDGGNPVGGEGQGRNRR